jgi:hypothetical protein
MSLGAPAWDKGITDMYRATEADGTFCYTFFKGPAVRESGQRFRPFWPMSQR